MFAIPTEVDRQSPVPWYEIGNGQAIADFDRTKVDWRSRQRREHRWCTGSRLMERSRNGSKLTLQTGTPATDKPSSRLQCLLSGFQRTGDPVRGRSIDCDGIDRIQSYPAAVSALIGSFGPSLLVVLRSVIDPGHHGLATKSLVRPLEARAGRLGGLCSSLRVPRLRGLSHLSSLADPTALSELPRPTLPRSCRLRGVRNALPGSLPAKELKSSPESLAGDPARRR